MRRFTAVVVALVVMAALHGARMRAQDGSHYKLVENWAHFPPEVAKFSSSTGVDVDSRDNVYVFHRDPGMPIMEFDRNGKFLRAWGKGMFKTTHFLRVDRFGYVWVTDRGDMQAFKFDPEGNLLMTLGKKGVTGDNESHDAFNGMADLAVAKNGDIFIADGEGPNTRVAKFAKDGKFIKWWGGKGTEPGQFQGPHSIAIDSKSRVFVADRTNKRIQIFDQEGKFLDQWTNFEVPWGLFITKKDMLYVVDGSANNKLMIANAKDGKIIDRLDGGGEPTAVAVDSTGAIYIAEVTGNNVRKYVKK